MHICAASLSHEAGGSFLYSSMAEQAAHNGLIRVRFSVEGLDGRDILVLCADITSVTTMLSAQATTDANKRLQRALNAFTTKYLKGVGHVRVDGVLGPSTRKRILEVKYWLGWQEHNTDQSDKFRRALARPRDWRITSRGTVARGIKRRAQHNAAWVRSHFRTGVVTYDGVRVARWIVPYLDYARRHGWPGHLVSGYRDPAYSERLCFAMCGAPRCPGRCAGRSSNHSGSVKPRGAIDVSNYVVFGRLMQRADAPRNPRLINRLGNQDPVHFSATGN